MEDAAAAAVEFVHGEDVFRIVVAYAPQRAELARNGLLCGEQIGDLDVDAPVTFGGDEVDLALAGFADGDVPTAPQELHADDVLKQLIHVSRIAAVDCLSESVIDDVVFLVDGEEFFPDDVLAADFVKKIGIAGGADIVQNGFGGDLSLLAFEIVRDAACAERVTDVCHDVGNDTLEEIDVAYAAALHDVLQYDGAVDVAQILPRGFLRVGKICEEGHAAALDVGVKCRCCVLRRSALDVLGKGKGIDDELDIAPAEIGVKFA